MNWNNYSHDIKKKQNPAALSVFSAFSHQMALDSKVDMPAFVILTHT